MSADRAKSEQFPELALTHAPYCTSHQSRPHAIILVLTCGMKTPIRLPLSAHNNFNFLRTTASRRVSTISARDDQTFFLPSGRVLGYAEYGCQTGYPLMFFHGFPSSRLEGRGLDHIARSRHLRIIAPDRPGFGLSTFQPHRRITDWPFDVQALAHHLRLSRFAILGGSGGGPYALACAHMLPREMLSAVGVMAGAGPWQAGTQDVPMLSRATYLAAKYWPTGFRGLTDVLVGTLRRGLATRPATRWIDNWLNKVKREHEGVSTTEERRKRVLRIAFEGFAQGAEGFVSEVQLLTQDWGFRFEDVAYDKIRLWHGTQDKNAPVRMARYMAERLPHSVLHEFEGETHFTLFRHLEKILSDLVPEAKSPDCSIKA